jgi:hypothetical protein
MAWQIHEVIRLWCLSNGNPCWRSYSSKVLCNPVVFGLADWERRQNNHSPTFPFGYWAEAWINEHFSSCKLVGICVGTTIQFWILIMYNCILRRYIKKLSPAWLFVPVNKLGHTEKLIAGFFLLRFLRGKLRNWCSDDFYAFSGSAARTVLDWRRLISKAGCG